MKLEGKTALITGAGGGMGRAMALLFAEEGAAIAICDINLQGLESTAAAVRNKGHRVLAIKADVSENREVEAMVDRIIRELGGVNILVNDAGVGLGGPAEELPVETWDKVVKINLRSQFLCCQKVGRWMIGHGGGRILNIASIGGVEGAPTCSGYGPSKAGVISLTRVLAVEWAKHNIRVNCIAPGAIMTPMLEGSVATGMRTLEDYQKRSPMGRVGQPEEIATAALFLVSDDSSYITGVTLPVDGGSLCYGQPTI
ncbi:MAG: oxidoreductase, short-chain dehydrogenase/reductase family [Chloroflexi bacterium]|jgi:NAD(P)-dependent dehydrogenase (short-subunit alcohol dehydrogenase family)|nr:oxidoreductase, short-chain dehydrogenase/reductase family [Chloroflexota bacterium]